MVHYNLFAAIRHVISKLIATALCTTPKFNKHTITQLADHKKNDKKALIDMFTSTYANT